MKKLFVLLIIGFISNTNASGFMENGELKLVDDKKYIIRCIELTKWIQFVDRGSGKGGIYYVPSGNPVQLFVNDKYNGTIMTLPCNEDKNN